MYLFVPSQLPYGVVKDLRQVRRDIEPGRVVGDRLIQVRRRIVPLAGGLPIGKRIEDRHQAHPQDAVDRVVFGMMIIGGVVMLQRGPDFL